MATQDTEDVLILSLMQGLDIFGHIIRLAKAKLQLASHLLVGAKVKLGDVYLAYYLRILLYGCLEVFHRRTIDVVVALHANTVDRRSHLLHLLHHIIYTVALSRLCSVVIIVEELDIGVGLAGKLEHLDDELLAAEVEHLRLAVRTRCFLHPWRATSVSVGNGLVEHVPCINNILITIDYSMDMVAQTLIENVLADWLSLLVGEHPVGKLAMPC